MNSTILLTNYSNCTRVGLSVMQSMTPAAWHERRPTVWACAAALAGAVAAAQLHRRLALRAWMQAQHRCLPQHCQQPTACIANDSVVASLTAGMQHDIIVVVNDSPSAVPFKC